MATNITKIPIVFRRDGATVMLYLIDAAAVQGRAGYYGAEQSWWLGLPGTMTLLGLDSQIDNKTVLVSLLAGEHPETGEKLRQAGVDSRTGHSVIAHHDITLSPFPKSVSVLWSLSDQEGQRDIEQGLIALSKRALEQMRKFQPVLRERYGPGSADVRFVEAADLAGAMFLHTTARESITEAGHVDPQLHTHCLMFGGVTQAGELRALEHRQMLVYRGLMTAASLGEAACWATDMGWEIRRTVTKRSGGGTRVGWEIEGVPPELVEAMSARSRDIAVLMAEFEKEFGEARGKEWDVAQAENRRAKEHYDPNVLRETWNRMGAEHGFSQAECAALAQMAKARRAQRPEEERMFRRSEHGREAAVVRQEILEEVCRDRAWVDLTQLYTVAAARSVGLLHWTTGLRVAANMMEAGDLVLLPGQRISTRAMVELETSTREAAGRLLDLRKAAEESEGWADDVIEEEEDRAGHPFDQGQVDAIRVGLAGGHLAILTGIAGAGKGSTTRAMTAGWHRQGRRVIATALAGKRALAARTDSGADEAASVAAILNRIERGRLKLAASDVVLVDEGAQLNHHQVAGLVKAVEAAGATLVMVGDDHQLAPIGAGGLWDELRGMAAQRGAAVELSENHRAADVAEGAAWLAVREGRMLEAARWWDSQGRLQIHNSRPEMLKTMVDQWYSQGQTGVMLVSTSNAERDVINRLAQTRRLESGELGNVPVAVRSGEEVRQFDRVIFNEPTNLPKVLVPVVIPEKTVTLKSGEVKMYPEHTENRWRSQPRIENGTLAEVVEVDRGRLQVRLAESGVEPEQARVVEIPAETAPVDLAYGLHVQKSQGDTVHQIGHAVIEPGAELSTVYPAISRSSAGAHIHMVRPEVETRHLEGIVREERVAGPEADQLAELFRDVAAHREAMRTLEGIGQRDEIKTAALADGPPVEARELVEVDRRISDQDHERHAWEFADERSRGWQERDDMKLEMAAQDGRYGEGRSPGAPEPARALEIDSMERHPGSGLLLDNNVVLMPGDRVVVNAPVERFQPEPIQVGAQGQVLDVHRGGPNYAEVQLEGEEGTRTLHHDADLTVFSDVAQDRPASEVEMAEPAQADPESAPELAQGVDAANRAAAAELAMETSLEASREAARKVAVERGVERG